MLAGGGQGAGLGSRVLGQLLEKYAGMKYISASLGVCCGRPFFSSFVTRVSLGKCASCFDTSQYSSSVTNVLGRILLSGRWMILHYFSAVSQSDLCLCYGNASVLQPVLCVWLLSVLQARTEHRAPHSPVNKIMKNPG